MQKCANTGEGIAPDLTELHDNDFPQLCAGIDYDFSNYKCYFLVGTELVKELCPVNMMPPPTPRDLVAKSSVVNILLCEYYQVAPIVNLQVAQKSKRTGNQSRTGDKFIIIYIFILFNINTNTDVTVGHVLIIC